MAHRILISALFFIITLCVAAQQIELRKSGKNEFSFSTKDLVLIKDIQLEGPSYHITDNPYQFTIIAVTETGAPDTNVNGMFTFSVNGTLHDLQFAQGKAVVEHNLGKAESVHVQLAQTNVEKSLHISRFSGTPALAGVAAFLLLTFLFRHQLARLFRKIFGKNKD